MQDVAVEVRVVGREEETGRVVVEAIEELGDNLKEGGEHNNIYRHYC